MAATTAEHMKNNSGEKRFTHIMKFRQCNFAIIAHGTFGVEFDEAALAWSRMYGLQTIQIEQTTETMLPSHKTITAAYEGCYTTAEFA